MAQPRALPVRAEKAGAKISSFQNRRAAKEGSREGPNFTNPPRLHIATRRRASIRDAKAARLPGKSAWKFLSNSTTLTRPNQSTMRAAFDTSLCERCQEFSVEDLNSNAGVFHGSLSDIRRRSCRFCALIVQAIDRHGPPHASLPGAQRAGSDRQSSVGVDDGSWADEILVRIWCSGLGTFAGGDESFKLEITWATQASDCRKVQKRIGGMMPGCYTICQCSDSPGGHHSSYYVGISAWKGIYGFIVFC